MSYSVSVRSVLNSSQPNEARLHKNPEEGDKRDLFLPASHNDALHTELFSVIEY